MAADGPSFEWHPAWVMRDPATSSYYFHLVILNQPIKHRQVFRQLWNRAMSRVAADGGANRVLEVIESQNPNPSGPDSQQSLQHLFRQDYFPLNLIMGDLDSLSNKARDFFAGGGETEIIQDSDQYSTDLTKALRHLLRRDKQQQQEKPQDIVCIGGLGGRVDQGLSQLHHLYMFQGTNGSELSNNGGQIEDDYVTNGGGGRIFLLSGESLTFLLRKGRHRIHAREQEEDRDKYRSEEGYNLGEEHPRGPSKDVFAKHVGIIPIRGPAHITTRGLEWDVTNWLTEFGGQMSTSNHVVKDVIEVETDEDVLFTIALKCAE